MFLRDSSASDARIERQSTGRSPSSALFEPLEGRQLLSTAVGLGTGNELILFDTSKPTVIMDRERISGLQYNEKIVGIDYRPANGRLYAVGKTGTTGRIYRVDPSNGRSEFVAKINHPLNGTEFGVDFNPVVDRLRVVSDYDQNLRIHPDTGVLQDGNANVAGVQPDGNLNYAAADRNAGKNPNVVGSAYSNSDNNTATGTTLYGIDSALDILVTQNPPNAGTLNTVGSLQFNTSQLVGFDIETKSGVNTAYASLNYSGSSSSKLFKIDLATGKATLIGNVGGDDNSRYYSYSGSDSRSQMLLRDVAIAPAGTTYNGGYTGYNGGYGGYDDDSYGSGGSSWSYYESSGTTDSTR
ncbi:MAG TPA: DUF4394 domain-containing protein [Tepidisphaeraceae bacterium]